MVTRVVCIFSWRVSKVKDDQDSHLDGQNSHKEGHDSKDSFHNGQDYHKDFCCLSDKWFLLLLLGLSSNKISRLTVSGGGNLF